MNQNQKRSMADRKQPHVQLDGEDGNAFVILGRTREAMRKVGWTKAEIAEATDSMMSGDYNNLLATVFDLCEVD